MVIGEKIKQERKNRGLSQEQLAEKLIVSRAAVAKWENNYGIPDIENLKKLSELFGISIDEFINASEKDKGKGSEKSDLADDCYKKYIGKKCSVEMTDWNDGIDHAYIHGYDGKFFYYMAFEKKQRKVGALAKKYIERIVPSCKREKENADIFEVCEIQIDYFIDKSADIFLEDKHFFDGILGEDTEILNVDIAEITEDFVKLASGKEIEIEKITKIEANYKE